MLFPTNVLLLASILSSSFGVDARPTKSRRDDGMIHLALKRAHNLARTDIHPLILFQKHANRGNRRLARMTGREIPTDEELRRNIEKRMYLLPGGRPKIQNAPTKTIRAHARDFVTDLLGKIDGVIKGSGDAVGAANVAAGGHHHGGNNGNDGAAVNCTDTGNGTTSTGNGNGNGNGNVGTGTGTGTGTDGNAGNGTTGGGDTSAGFSQVDLDAALSGGLTASKVTESTGTTGLDIEANDVGYIATIQIGTPPADFKTLMDSGSADFWVGAADCVNDQSGQACSAKHTTLSAKTSSSFVDTKKQFQVTYGSGAVAGDIVTDDVTLAGMTLKTHTFGTSSVETVDFSDDSVPFDGLIGLAQSTLSNQGVLTPVESLAKQGTIKAAITSFKISRLADGKDDGQVTFGGLDQTLFDANSLVTVDNVSKVGFWEAAVDSFTVDGKDLGLSGRTAILDTGTTLVIAPAADAAAIHAAIPGSQSDGQGGFTIPCTTTSSIALSFGGTSFAIDPRDVTFLPVNQNDLTGDCVSGISSGNVGGAQEWLVGDVFLKNAYFSTDVGNNQISLAKLV